MGIHWGYFDPDTEPFDDMRQAYAPLVWQCRYSGIEVPDTIWSHARTGIGLPYSENQSEDVVQEDEIISAFASFVAQKGRSRLASIAPTDTKQPGTRCKRSS